MEKDTMIRDLKTSVCTVEFTKVDGEVRVMDCTLNESLIPDESKPKVDAVPRKENEAVLRVYDTVKQGWRSFRLDAVTQFSVKA